MAFVFEKLIVYQKAMDFSDEICQLTCGFPRGYYFLTDQLNRAALSIAANIAEGNGRFTKPDRKNFFGVARGSVQECVPLLELARRRSLVESERHESLKEKLEEIDHEHCGVCNLRISEEDSAYLAEPEPWWVCEACYRKWVSTADLGFIVSQ